MKRAIGFAAAVLLAAFLAFPAAAAKYTCTDLEWPDQINSIHEHVAPGCDEVIEQNGVRYGVYSAVFISYRSGDVTLIFKMPEGENVTETFRPPEDFLVELEGKKVPFSELVRGQHVTVMIPEQE